MSDADWIDEHEAPKKKRRFPKWLLGGCGCGCLLVVLLVVVAGMGFKRMVDPDVQWPRLQEVLPFEERPTDLQLVTGLSIPFADVQQFQLMSSAGAFQAQVHDFGSSKKAGFESLFEEDPDQIPFGLTEPEDAVLGEMEVQGRTVRTLRFTTLGGFSSVEALGPGVRVDVSRGDREIMVQFNRLGSKEELTDDEIREFFGKFDLWQGN